MLQLHGPSSVDQGTPQSWKYYLNISGQYHSTDTMMTVTSLDTLEEINFTKGALADHTATLAAYRDQNSRYFYSLVNRYPDQILLIKGITTPAIIDEAIVAKDGSILSYPTDLVEPQEQTLIKDLEGFIYRYLVRWNVQAFGLTDTLYNTSFHALLYLSLLPKLLNLRIQRCKTAEAHSFHIRQYLASHNGLDKYLPYMTLKQALFFYRNIRLIERNTGKSETLDLLIQKILTDRQIPIAEYSIRHLNSFDEAHYPNVRTRRKPINTLFNAAEKDFVSTAELFLKEDLLVDGNSRYHLASTKVDNTLFKNSASSVVQTKNLESNMVDYNGAVPDPIETVLLRQWAYMSTHNLYRAVINFKDPKTGDLRVLAAKDALIYFNYITLKSLGIEYNLIAPFYIEKFRLPVKPALNTLLSGIDSKDKTAIASAKALWQRQPQIVASSSVRSFFAQANLLYEESLKHWITLGNTHDLRERGTLEGFILKLYGDKIVQLDTTDITIDAWLVKNNLPEYNFTYLQAQDLLTNIFLAATGLTVDETKLLKNIQRNLIEMLGHLSSYTIQLIREINDSKIRPLNWQATRSHTESTVAEALIWSETNNRLYGETTQASTVGFIDTTPVEFLSSDSQQRSLINIETAVNVTFTNAWDVKSEMSLSPVYLQASYPGYDPAISTNAGFIGKELFLALTDVQKNSIKSFYN